MFLTSELKNFRGSKEVGSYLVHLLFLHKTDAFAQKNLNGLLLLIEIHYSYFASQLFFSF